MGNPNYTKVNSIYFPDSDNCDLMIRAESTGSDEWAYAFYDESSVPDYMKTHAARHKEAQRLDVNVKISRMVKEHMNEDAEEDWRLEE